MQRIGEEINTPVGPSDSRSSKFMNNPHWFSVTGKTSCYDAPGQSPNE
jgi:hypothetical protein